MIKDLKLRNFELLIYALIYSFCQKEENNKCYCSLSYFVKRLGTSRPTICKSLASLIAKGYINKYYYYKGAVKHAYYIAVKPKGGLTFTTANSKKSSKCFEKKQLNVFTKSSKETKPNIKEYKKDILKCESARAGARKRTRTQNNINYNIYGVHNNVLLTEEQYNELVKKYPKEGKAKIDRLSVYMFTTSKSYTNHFALLCAWIEEDKSKAAAQTKNKNSSLNCKPSFDIEKIARRAKLNDNYNI
jgi:DNA-binding MarR family transcriptional regulator